MDLSRRAQDEPEARHHNRTMDTVTSATPGSGPAGSALLWAGAVGWLGAMGLAALSTLWWVTAGVVVAVAEAIHPELEPSPDSSGLVMVTVLAAAWCVARLAATRRLTVVDAFLLGVALYLLLVHAGPSSGVRSRVPVEPVLALYAARGLADVWVRLRPNARPPALPAS